MNQNAQGQRPDTTAVLASLKAFQRDSVEYAFERLYRAADSTRRFLVADEVGLGKTLVARGVIAKAIDHLWEGPNRVERIDIVYICSNAQIARQNVRRLQIGEKGFVRAARLGLLPREIHDLKKNRVNYLALTPGTSLDLKSSMGIREERILLYHLLKRVWPEHGTGTGPMNLFQGLVQYRNTGYFRWELNEFERWYSIDEGLASVFERRLQECEGLSDEYAALCNRFRRSRKHIPWDDRRRQINFIRQLRLMLAEVCVSALEPDLVILDEFQRFKNLLEDENPTATLARRLFTYSDSTSSVRLLLLSATPYRMYTLHHESAEDDHYQDFLRTTEFLDPQLKSSGRLRRLLDEYRQAMYRIESGTGPLQQINAGIEGQLRRIMSRTERLRASSDSDEMLREVPSPGLSLTAGDIQDFLVLEKIGDAVRQPQVMEYWKSAPYLLSFMDDYRLKTEVVARLGLSAENGLASLLAESGRTALSWEDVRAYAQVDPANARLRSLLEWLDVSGAWKLLWLPPSLPYYSETGPWQAASERQLTKRLIFSTWQVVPKAIACLVSYDVERRILVRFDGSIQNTPEERRRRRPLLRFAYSNERLTGMPVLGILYPSPGLAELGDPAAMHRRGATLDMAVARASSQLEPLVARLTEPYLGAAREDESWYWAAPILLDFELCRESTQEWFDRHDLGGRWTGANEDEEEGSRWDEHVEEARRLARAAAAGAGNLSFDLGRPPANLVHVLAMLSVAGPANCALRALTRTSGPGGLAAQGGRDAAARIAWSFRRLFNHPEATALIRAEGRAGGAIPFWRQVVDYCARGNLQAVLDEYVHVLRDLEGLFAAGDDEAWDRLAEAMTGSLMIRTGAPGVDEFRAADGTVSVQKHRMRNYFAMRFGVQESEDGRAGAREGQVRQAFNSPFWPFVLASTSVGQEGLDFHAYCHSVVHWNLPSNPVDLEQREGRIHRYKGHAVRKNVAARYRGRTLDGDPKDIWTSLFEIARQQGSSGRGLMPYWLFPLEGGAHIERHVPALPLSRDASRLEALKRLLAVYRMVFGQPRQDDLVAFLQERFSSEKLKELEPLLRIDLCARPAEES